MDIVALLNGLAAQIAALNQALIDAQAAADSIATEAYAKGYAEGVASVVVPPPVDDVTPFSQADVDAAVALAVQPVMDELAAVKAELEGVKGELEMVKASVEQAKLDAVAGFKAELLAKFEEAMAQENAVEAAFGEMLK